MFQKIDDKKRTTIGAIMFLLSVLIMSISGLIYHYFSLLWIMIVGVILTALCFVFAIIIFPTSGKNDAEKSKTKSKKKTKKKKPFISESEWKELEEEEDETTYIEEYLEDDK